MLCAEVLFFVSGAAFCIGMVLPHVMVMLWWFVDQSSPWWIHYVGFKSDLWELCMRAPSEKGINKNVGAATPRHFDDAAA